MRFVCHRDTLQFDIKRLNGLETGYRRLYGTQRALKESQKFSLYLILIQGRAFSKAE